MVQDHFWKNAFWTHFSPIFGPKTAHFQGILGFSMAQNAWGKTRHHGLKTGLNHFFEHPEWSRISFGKMRFSTIFDPFLVPKRPLFKVFRVFPWPKTRHHGLKTA